MPRDRSLALLRNEPLTIFKQRWRKDDEALRNALLNHLDDLRYDGMITRPTFKPPGEVFGKPPSHVLVVCPTCGVGAAESKVIDGWTAPHECPTCHHWIPAETYLPKYARRRHP